MDIDLTYILWYQKSKNVNLVFGIKNIFQLEGVINLCESCFNFLNRSIPFFLKENIVFKPKEQKYIMIEAPFVEDVFGHGYSQNVRHMRTGCIHAKT